MCTRRDGGCVRPLFLLALFHQEKPGGAEGIRTPDLCSAIAALSHLSYSPKALAF